MPLTMAITGEKNIIRKVGGNSDLRKHLKNIGFTPGSDVTVISDIGGNLIVNIKECRIAINREMAGKILVTKS